MDSFSVIASPVVTEKSVSLGEGHSRYAVYVAVGATKPQVRRAIKLLCGEAPTDVCSLRVKGKRKRCKGVPGRRKDRKKVYFSLPKGKEFKIVGAAK
ncbi:50S ribosomal protein L23 [Anaplasma marginale]|nr:50S ribosomal protein L23 [Anaplasma marginale]AXW84231.1 50S ribosomal protein L23 [Anaplasma marginale]AXW85155.1 50S ribosomal protein L23 [Anaplasma marginale]KAA8472192.1 50S ribosomal protein L23 [Anaplasma marginale]KAA8473983.1 50S ribosomal protein L23 [Anaplasma marginale]KAB0450546.1 50S ribosomal protein L23 [Anaplasma marginale]